MKSRKLGSNLCIVGFSAVFLIYILIFPKQELEPKHIVHYVNENSETNNCYGSSSDKESDISIPVSDTEEFPPNSIHFLETSCKGGVNSRQACCVESAARSNPGRQVNLIFIGIVTGLFKNSATMQSLLQYTNVHISRIHPPLYVKGTPVESLFVRKDLSNSQYHVEHTADVLRILTLHKHGGIYLDTDMIVIKSFDTLPKNWMVKENEGSMGNAIMALSRDATAKNFTTTALQSLNATYSPTKWSFNGPELINRILSKWCITGDIAKMNETTCPGIAVFAPKNFYPRPWWEWKKYFELDSENYTLGDPYTHHFNNKLSKNVKIHHNSLIAKLAKKHCPTIFNLYKEDFGN